MSGSAASTGRAARPAILIVEDEWLLATDLADMVESIGYGVLGPAHSVSAALDLIGSARIDGGLLDVNLRGKASYPVAQALMERGIPFAFLSGYASDQLRPDFEDRPLLSKPIEQDALRARLDLMLRAD